MAAAAHNPQACKCVVEGGAWQRIQSDYQPAAGGEGAADMLQRVIHDLGRNEGSRNPRQGESCRLLKPLHALRAKLHPFDKSAVYEVLPRECQSRLPRVNTDYS